MVCEPPRSIVSALRMNDKGDPDYAMLCDQWDGYCHALEHEIGGTLIRVPANETCPDSVFPEDPFGAIGSKVIKARLFAPSRQPEFDFLKPTLLKSYHEEDIIEMQQGTLEFGDTVLDPNRKIVFVGIRREAHLPSRTSHEGAEELGKILGDLFGYTLQKIYIPTTQLHLKGCASYHPYYDTFIASDQIADQVIHIYGEKLIVTPSGEQYGANGVSYGTPKVLVGKENTESVLRLKARGLAVVEVPSDQFVLIDGALSCLSKVLEQDRVA